MKKMTAKEILTSRALDYLESHYMDKFCLEDIASALFINKNYLSRAFKETTGNTLLWQHNHLRCEAAEKLLANPTYSITEISEKTGFISASHFTRIFKNHTGCTPSSYRKDLFR